MDDYDRIMKELTTIRQPSPELKADVQAWLREHASTINDALKPFVKKTADEIIDKANSCGCGGQKNQLGYHVKNGDHVIHCFNCDLYVAANQVDYMLDHWNYRNPLPAQAGSNDKTFGQAQDELLTKIIDQKQLVFNALCTMFVKKTADELPDELTQVLIWADNQWMCGHLCGESWWGLGEYPSYHSEVKYWLPLPTFNPENTKDPEGSQVS